jgi:hypothetical protein
MLGTLWRARSLLWRAIILFISSCVKPFFSAQAVTGSLFAALDVFVGSWEFDDMAASSIKQNPIKILSVILRIPQIPPCGFQVIGLNGSRQKVLSSALAAKRLKPSRQLRTGVDSDRVTLEVRIISQNDIGDKVFQRAVLL